MEKECTFTEDLYYSISEILNSFKERDVYIYGYGKYGKWLYERIKKEINVNGYIDKNSNIQNDIRIINPCDLSNQLEEKSLVIISSLLYCDEMKRILDENGLLAGKDYVILDDSYVMHPDNNVKRFIEYNKKKWQRKENVEERRRILIPFDNVYDTSHVWYAYIANYFAEKFNAEIECYFPLDYSERDIFKPIKDIYKSFGTKYFADIILTDNQEQEASLLVNEIWEKITDYESLLDITIYGINFGLTIVRDYLRWGDLELGATNDSLKDYLVKSIRRIVYWHRKFLEYEYCAVVLWDGVHRDGYIRDLSVLKEIPTYTVHYAVSARLTVDYYPISYFKYYKDFWDSLSNEEKKYGKKWGENHLQRRIKDNAEDIPFMQGHLSYLKKNKDRVLEMNNNKKILICPHIFGEESYLYGNQIFDNNFISWLEHIGELSNKYENVDWYLKIHPLSEKRDKVFFGKYLKKYKNIHDIPADTSPIVLKEEGIGLALTVHGSIGYEFQYIGIPVINAGSNPHQCFDFGYNPRTKEEYDKYILDFIRGKLNIKTDIVEIYKYYAMNFLFYNTKIRSVVEYFFLADKLKKDWIACQLSGETFSTTRYDYFLSECKEGRHEELLKKTEEFINSLDNWKEDFFYKNTIH